jgi:aspartate/glutamate racemase
MPERKVALIHTSPAALGPVAQFYGEAAPELELTNLLDDGLLRLLAAGERVTALRRLGEMIAAARDTHGAELALITCSSVTMEMAAELRARLGLPILKIDYPMARLAVRTGRRIGVAATFPPTLVPTGSLLLAAAAEAGAEIELVKEVVPEAYQALLAGDHGRHDELLLGAIERLEGQGADAIVLAQVSMARILPRLEGRARVPVFSSLHTSLDAIRAELAGRN